MKQAMVFAAGLGTRLRPLTDHMPKALVDVGGQPLLWHVLTKLKHEGFGRVVINVHHFAEQITAYLRSNSAFGLDIRVSDESRQLLDTGGGIRKARCEMESTSPILIHNVDILSNAPLTDLYDGIGEADALLLVSSRQSTRHLLFSADHRLRGWENTTTGEVRPAALAGSTGGLQPYAFSGIHVLSPSLLDTMEQWPERFSIIDFYLSCCADTQIRGHLKEDLRLMDVGKTDTLHQAEKFLQTI